MRGKGYVEVSRTGEKSAMGRLAGMIGGIEAEKTPLERRMENFGGQIARAGARAGGIHRRRRFLGRWT